MAHPPHDNLIRSGRMVVVLLPSGTPVVRSPGEVVGIESLNSVSVNRSLIPSRCEIGISPMWSPAEVTVDVVTMNKLTKENTRTKV